MILVNLDAIAVPGADIATRAPSPKGLEMWRTLKQQNRDVIALCYNENIPRDKLDHWLAKYDVVASYIRELGAVEPAVKAKKIQLVMDSFGRTDWYVDSDIMTVKETWALGIPSILICTPEVGRPEWHDRVGPLAWEALIQEKEAQTQEKQQRSKAYRDWRDL